MWHHTEELSEAFMPNEETPENIQEFLREDQSEALIVWGIEDFYFRYIDDNASILDVWPLVDHLFTQDISPLINDLIDIQSIVSVNSDWKYIFISYIDRDWNEKSISIDIISALLWHDDYIWELDAETAERIHFQEIEKYLHNVEMISQWFDAIDRILERNQDEFWEEIDEYDIATEWPFVGKDIATIFSEIPEYFSESRVLQASIFTTDDSLWEIDVDFQLLQERYAWYLLGLWENNEDLTTAIPKSQEEIDHLLESIVHSKTPNELIEYMKDIHSQLNSNNWQDGTVEKNYAYFTDMMNELVFTKMKYEVLNNSEWSDYLNINILLQFASLVSGRTGGFESHLRQSDMDSRLWRPDMSRRILTEAMKVSWWVLEQVSDNIDMQDEVLGERSPTMIVRETISEIEAHVFSTDENGQEVALNGRDVLVSLWFQKSIENALCTENYNSLSFDDMIVISSLARVVEALKPADEYTTVDWIHDDQGEKRVERWIMGESSHMYMQRDNEYNYEYASSLWMTGQTVYRERNKEKKLSFDELKGIIMWTTQKSIEHVWGELNRNFDDSNSEKSLWFLNGLYWWMLMPEWILPDDVSRITRVGLTPWSTEANIFSLYNDMEGNGWLFEISDATRDSLKTAWYLIANVAWAMIVWWILIATLPVSGAIIWGTSGALIWTVAAQNLLVQWSLYWLSASAVWYWLDAAAWDARGFGTRQEALVWISSDFVLGWLTGFAWWLVAARYWARSTGFLSSWDITNKSIFAWDLLFLWIWPEILRIKAVQDRYHSSWIFTENEPE